MEKNDLLMYQREPTGMDERGARRKRGVQNPKQARDARSRLSAANERITALESENAKLRAEKHGFCRTEAILIASAIAHRACCGTEHDPANGKIHGYCVVCGVPWPCDTAKSFMPPESILGDKEDA